MDKMKYYNTGRNVPDEAKKTIGAGKLKGFTDINPMWRIQMLTEMFGPCGIGWYTEIKRTWCEEGKDGRVAAFCEILLYINVDGEWSKPIEGIGGSMLVNRFKGEPETSDECYKMAYTDAISVATKALGIGADVYWAAGRTKYSLLEDDNDPEKGHDICIKCKKKLPEKVELKSGKTVTGQAFAKKFGGRCPDCFKAEREAQGGDGSY